ncbi:MAG: plastid ribosomal protein L18 [Monoraphidium minutum]|nr:MAG: plastid ribosomal protein L18 [Monoraphidium minutum]
MFSSSLPQTVARAAPSTGRAFTPVVCKSVAESRKARTTKRHMSIRKKVSGTPERPRLAVFRSNQHIYAQVIDDTRSVTLAAASTLTPDVKAAVEGKGATVAAAEAVGKKVAELAKAAGVEKVAFDRGGFTYHGRVQALADAAREGGLSF